MARLSRRTEPEARIWIFEVPGVPVPWQRPRKRKFGGYYEVDAVTAWRQVVAAYALQVRPPEPTRAPLALSLTFRLPRPMSLPLRERYPRRKPDDDNLAKGIRDCLERILYVSDAQVCRSVVEKRYVKPGEVPGVEVVIAELL